MDEKIPEITDFKEFPRNRDQNKKKNSKDAVENKNTEKAADTFVHEEQPKALTSYNQIPKLRKILVKQVNRFKGKFKIQG